MNRPEVHQAGVRDVAFGARVKIVEPCNLYGCKIGDDCFVGPFTEIQKGVVIGARTRVQSHAFVCELVTIGEDCFVGHGVMFVNDTFSTGGPARGRRELWRETVIGNRVSVGSNATIMPGQDRRRCRDRRRFGGHQGHHETRHLCRQSGAPPADEPIGDD